MLFLFLSIRHTKKKVHKNLEQLPNGKLQQAQIFPKEMFRKIQFIPNFGDMGSMNLRVSRSQG